MAKRVFFSFHYKDVADFRANVVRNHWVAKSDREQAGYFDASVWESARRQGESGLKRLINGALEGTSNTCVLIGSDTATRPWVRYELLKSFRRGNHIFAVHINGIRGRDQLTKPLGRNPLECVGVTFSSAGKTATLWEQESSGWVEYDKIDGSAQYSFEVDGTYRGKGFSLAAWYPVYNWIADDGFNQFANWVK